MCCYKLLDLLKHELQFEVNKVIKGKVNFIKNKTKNGSDAKFEKKQTKMNKTDLK